MQGTPFIIGDGERAALQALRDKAAKSPVYMPDVVQQVMTPRGWKRHIARMNKLTIRLSFNYAGSRLTNA